jgi:hypothetical protein
MENIYRQIDPSLRNADNFRNIYSNIATQILAGKQSLDEISLKELENKNLKTLMEDIIHQRRVEASINNGD